MFAKRLAYIDIEATSALPERGHIIELALLVKDEKGEIVDHFHSLIRPPSPVPENITQLTGITNAMLANRPEFHSVAQKVFNKLEGLTLVAHKVEFDSKILRLKFEELGLDFSPQTFCTLEQAIKTAPGMKSYSLASLCEFFGIKLQKNHRALDDVEATIQLKETLDLLNSHIGKEKSFKRHLPKHKKIIDKAPAAPGRIFFRSAQGPLIDSFATDDIRKELAERLSLCSKNRPLLSRPFHVSFCETGSLSKALLLETRKSPPLSWSIYSVKGKDGQTILRCGKTRPHKAALLYFEDKKSAITELKRIVSKLAPQNKLVYNEGPKFDKSEIARRDRLLDEEIKKRRPEVANTLFRSRKALSGMFQYVYVDDSYRYAIFEDANKIDSREQISVKTPLKKLRPSERKALEMAMLYAKNQKRKTDSISKLKRS